MNGVTLLMVVCGVTLNTSAQFLLKQGTRSLGVLRPASWIEAAQFFLAAAFNPYIVSGLLCYVVSFGLWIGVLSRSAVSVAYPMLSLGYVLSLFASYLFLGESITPLKIVGIVLIVSGVIALSRA